ncbi:hypothetical protein H5410_014486 [Solanum commersonii]|uniref:Uncharacterized protein n=1 Tax=Solanum commersonii TaxID=4109 RepID=A0A9J5ZR42_SOLCO|nr:hypothetical protein H5410_014482 [Solanum commersonii]KAG5614662.1 hypothetical protein H5410_014486 [Solanum commersonii]
MFFPEITSTLPFHLPQRSPQRSSIFQKSDAPGSSPWPPHVLLPSYSSENGSGPPKNGPSVGQPYQIDLKRSIFERFSSPS